MNPVNLFFLMSLLLANPASTVAAARGEASEPASSVPGGHQDPVQRTFEFVGSCNARCADNSCRLLQCTLSIQAATEWDARNKIEFRIRADLEEQARRGRVRIEGGIEIRLRRSFDANE